MQSSIGLDGVQWNMPVLSYFISVATKSKSLAWSSAIPTSNLLFAFLSEGFAVGLQKWNLIKAAQSVWNIQQKETRVQCTIYTINIPLRYHSIVSIWEKNIL